MKVVRYHLTPEGSGWICQEQTGDWNQFWTRDFAELGPNIQAAIEQALSDAPSRNKTIDVADVHGGGLTIGLTRYLPADTD